MQQQNASLSIVALAIVGAIITINRKGQEPLKLLNGHESVQHSLQPGDTLTIEVASDDEWLARVRENDARATAEIQQRDADAARRAFEEEQASKGGQTLEEGLKQADASQPDPGTSAAAAGEVTQDTGATRTRSTRNLPRV